MDPNQFNLFIQNQNKSLENNLTPTSGSALTNNGLSLTPDQVNQQNLNYVYNQRVNLNNLPTQDNFNSIHSNNLRMNQMPFNNFQQQMQYQQPVQLSAVSQAGMQSEFNANQMLFQQRNQMYQQLAPQATMVPTDNQLGISQTNTNQNLQFGNVTSISQNPLETQSTSQFAEQVNGIQKNPQVPQVPQPSQASLPQQPVQLATNPAQPNLTNLPSNPLQQMPSANPALQPAQAAQPNLPAALSQISPAQLRALTQKVTELRSKGSTEENDPEYAKLANILRAIANHVKANQNALSQSAANLNQSTPENRLPVQAAYAPIQPAPATPTAFGNDQLKTVKDQISSYRLISRNLPLTPNLQQSLQQPVSVPNAAASNLTQPQTLTDKIDAASQKYVASEKSEADQNSQISGENIESFVSPYALLSGPSAKKQHLIVPSITPGGIDPYTISREREERIKLKIQDRIKELENIPSNLSNYSIEDPIINDHKDDQDLKSIHAPKIAAVIELKSLRLLNLQKKVRDDIVKCMNQSNTLTANLDRTSYRRVKKQNIREARNTEKLERQQRAERERKEKQKHTDFITTILNHGRDLQQYNRNLQARQSKIGKFVTSFHQSAEKEEQKRIERLQRHRIELLKTGNEAEYMKLIDKAKDSRLTHLLQETNNFLKTLSDSVREQQQHVATFNVQNSVGENVSKIDFDEDEDGENIDYYAIAHKIRETINTQPNILVGGRLKEYQLKGLEWMVSLFNNNLNGILADEMGLGKTIQTISLVTHLIDAKKINGPYLIIVPLSTIPNWNNEFDKWAPEVRKIVYKGDPNHRKQLQLELRHENFQVLLTTFEYIIKDKNVLSRFKWVHTIIDEGHRMKNATSKLSVTLNQFYSSRNRLILTGTPLQNNLPELWALLNFILPKVFNSVSTFEEWFNSPFSNQGGQDKIALNEEEQLLIIKRLHKVLRPFLLRRLKKDVESELPDKKEHIIRCRMSALQSRLYSQMKQHKNLFLNSGSGGKPRMTGLNNTLMQLRKICNHPYVFQEVEQVINPTNRNDSKLYRVAGKFELLDRMLPKLFEFGHRCLIFFQMTQVMTIMEDFLAYRGIKYLRLDGTTKHDDRSNMLAQFNAPDSEIEVFLLSTRAGGLGLNLQTADTVIIFDSDWNPHQDLQAQDRAHRIGQKKEVRIFRLITANSVEEKILERAQYKLDMDGKVIQAGRFDNKTTEQEREEILKGCFAEDDEDDADDEDFNDEILNSMIARSDTEKQRFAQMDKERIDREKHEHSLNGGSGPVPDRLIQDHELPDVYLQDHNSEDASTPVEVLGRGQRARERVFYDDGLTEEQYAEAVDSGNLDELVAKNRVKQLKREAKRLKKSGANSSKEPSPSITSPSAMDTPGSQGNRGRPKRKRGNDDATDTPATPPIQSRSHRPGSANSLPSHIRRVVQHTFNQVYTAIQDVTDPDYPDYPNRPRWEIFAELPDENDYADYYQLIQNPIAMDIIKKRIDKHYYKDVVTFRNDWHLMFNNARTYNVEESQVYQDADELQRVLDDKLDELCPGNQFPDIDPNDLPQAKKRGRKPQSRLAASPNVDSIRSSPSATSADHRPHRSNKRVLHDDDDSDGNN